MTKRLIRPILIAIAVFFIALAFYSYAAINFPTLFNLDNQVNHVATRYIAKNHKIPVVVAGDEDILFSKIGTTRALRPPFTFIVSAVVSNLTQDVIKDPIIRQRLGASVIGAVAIAIIFIGFWFTFNNASLAFLGAISIGLLPKFVFLASCNNDDIGAILSVSLLFTSVLALLKYRHKKWVLFALAFSFGLVLQTKFTAWLSLPWFGLFSLALLKPVWLKLIKWLPLLLLISFAAGGWWLVFNMINYGIDDPTASRYASEIQHNLSGIESNKQGYSSKGVGVIDLLSNHDQFLSKSFRSFVGYLQWLELNLNTATYLFYGAIFVIGLLGVLLRAPRKHKEQAYLDYILLITIVSQCLFYLHHNWLRDIQPQARYVLPMIMPMVYLFLQALHNLSLDAVTLTIKGRKFNSQVVLPMALSVICITLFYQSLTQHIIPTFQPKSFFTSIENARKIELTQAFKVKASSAITYKFDNNGLTVQRTEIGDPALILGSEFCNYLKLNTLILIDISSSLEGGFYLSLDQNNKGAYENSLWHSFPAGNSTAALTVNAKDCTSAKFTLSKNTYQLNFRNFRVSELKIHEHGKPI